MIKFIKASDLHIDFGGGAVNWKKYGEEADILVVAGDTANAAGTAGKYLRAIAKHFRLVLVVDGNHEHYANGNQRRTVEEARQSFRNSLPENVILLSPDPDQHKLGRREGDYRFIGCNGWYSMDALGDPEENKILWKRHMNDCRWIGFDRIAQPDPRELARRDAEHLMECLDWMAVHEPEVKAIVITHTAPCRESITWKPEDPHWDRMNSFYMNRFMEEVFDRHAERISVWTHGHTHRRRDVDYRGVRVVVNPRGYPFPPENPGWTPINVEVD